MQCDSLVVALQSALAGGGLLLATAPLIEPFLASGALKEVFAERRPARLAHHMVVPETGAAKGDVDIVARWLLDNRLAFSRSPRAPAASAVRGAGKTRAGSRRGR